ncbi:MAG TPA: hypothetical protein VJO13_15755, partial [Ktedonobacterales bacterium]|nr:hypothetical protein [Ktedonobacterales bacterium]
MSNQTLRRPPSNTSGRKPARPGQSSSKSNRYRRQTARIGLETRRDGKPLFMGWGGHLSRLQKHRIQNRAAYTFFGVMVGAVLAVLLFGVLQQKVLIPNQSIVSVNGSGITQDSYRKELAYRAQTEWNLIQSLITQEQAAAKKAQSGDTKATTEDQALISQIQAEESNYAQASLTQSAVDALINDQLIQAGAKHFETQDHAKASLFEPSADAINKALASFKQAFPKGETYSKFVSSDSLSDDDVRAAIAVELRSNMMKTYLQSLLVSPAKQVHLRRIQIDTPQHAATVHAALVKDSSDANWLTQAKQQSLDPTTKTVGGDMGWVFQGESDALLLDWAFGPNIKVGDISPVLKDTNGTYNVIQVLGIDPKRDVDPSQLTSAKNNALDHWLGEQKALPGAKITTADTTMLSAARNLPTVPDLNAQLPN